MDKSKFNLFRFDGLQWCRRGPGEEYDVRNVDAQVKHGRGILMVWGCIIVRGFWEVASGQREDGSLSGHGDTARITSRNPQGPIFIHL